MDTCAAPPLCQLDDLTDGEATAIDVMLDGASENLIVLRTAGEVRGWLNICPHAGRRLDWAPGKFLLSQGLLTCAVHGASFRTDDGECVGGPCRGEHLQAIPLQVQDGGVYLAS